MTTPRYVGRFNDEGLPFSLFRATGWDCESLVDGEWQRSPIAADYCIGDEIGTNLTEAEARHAARWMGWPEAVPIDTSETTLPVEWSFASDIDGVRHVIVHSPGDFAAYAVETRRSYGETEFSEFYETTVFGSGRRANFLGSGNARLVWVAVCDHSDTFVRIVRTPADE